MKSCLSPGPRPRQQSLQRQYQSLEAQEHSLKSPSMLKTTFDRKESLKK